ncbi:MATE family efflux transporter [Cloacibacillus porcorum]|jgi:putative MATE family efflux protein|uniref:MATE family efflux transporter n=1 Tax=Cloacibacillus porcorum TaxID=1197717 RepID=UPI00235521FF|nr:MATE family efflux transporter [Cloacibacillus porcorum]MCI5863708.1 MATE family efflux transporter [Cloacibacillus porcorum]
MGSEPIPRLILSFALPAIIGMIAGAIYNIVDRIFVGRYVGSVGLAAITVSFPMMMMLMAFTLLICVGGASRVSILFGANKRRPAEQALTTTFVLLAIVGVASIAASFFATDTMLRLAGGSGEVLEMARPYLRIILLGAPFALFGFGANFLVRASGNPKYAMCTQIVGAVSNVLFDAFFIITLNMGVEGAAYGTVLAQAVSAIFGLSFFWRREAPLRIRAHFIGLPRWEVFKRICAVGSAPFFMELSFVCYMTLMNQLIIKYGGDDGLSAMGIFLSLDSLLFLPAMAIGEASQPIVGYNYGAGMPQRVTKAIYCALGMAVGFYIISFTLAEIFAEPLTRLFTNDPALLAIGVPGMRVGYVGLPFMGVTIVTNSALQGLGKGFASLALSFCRHVLCMFIPLIILPRIFGLLGVWMSFPCGDIGGCVISAGFLIWIIRWLKSPEALVVK